MSLFSFSCYQHSTVLCVVANLCIDVPSLRNMGTPGAHRDCFICVICIAMMSGATELGRRERYTGLEAGAKYVYQYVI